MRHTPEQILDFLNGQPTMVISTLSDDDRIASAVVGFGQTENFELVFGTRGTTRKAQNILKKEKVTAVIGFDHTGTVQYEGVARKLTGPEIDRYAEYHFHKHPKSRQYKDDPKEMYFLVTPTWLRFTEVEYSPWKVSEIVF